MEKSPFMKKDHQAAEGRDIRYLDKSNDGAKDPRLEQRK